MGSNELITSAVPLELKNCSHLNPLCTDRQQCQSAHLNGKNRGSTLPGFFLMVGLPVRWRFEFLPGRSGRPGTASHVVTHLAELGREAVEPRRTNANCVGSSISGGARLLLPMINFVDAHGGVRGRDDLQAGAYRTLPSVVKASEDGLRVEAGCQGRCDDGEDPRWCAPEHLPCCWGWEVSVY